MLIPTKGVYDAAETPVIVLDPMVTAPVQDVPFGTPLTVAVIDPLGIIQLLNAIFDPVPPDPVLKDKIDKLGGNALLTSDIPTAQL